jgi:signal transduction histidine kinase
LSELIDGVLLTEKLEAGEVTIAPAETTLGRLMEPVETLRGPAEQKGLRFHTAYDPDLTLAVDVDLTRSVLQNLAENAVKYTDDGEVEFSITNEGDEVVIDVRDTCKGLSLEELGTIFEPFKRGRTDKTGTGLGLAIARRAVAAQGGSIHAESPGPSGCHSSVRLPRYAVRNAAPAHAPAP